MLQVVRCTPIVLKTSFASEPVGQSIHACILFTDLSVKASEHGLASFDRVSFFFIVLTRSANTAFIRICFSLVILFVPNRYFIFSPWKRCFFLTTWALNYKQLENSFFFAFPCICCSYMKLKFRKRHNECHWQVLKYPKRWLIIIHSSLVGRTSFSLSYKIPHTNSLYYFVIFSSRV